MSEISTVTTATLNSWVQLADNNPTDFSTSLDNLLEDFSTEELGNGVTQELMKEIVGKLRDLINDSNDLPASIVDKANAQLDSFLSDMEQTCPCSAEAADAISNTDQASQLVDMAEGIIEAAQEQMNETATGTTVSPETGAITYIPASITESTEAETEAANEGTTTTSSDEAGTNTAESANNGLDEGNEEREAGNWLLVLAKTLADVQSKFLDAAMANSRTMSEQSGNVVAGAENAEGSDAETKNADGSDSKSEAFLQAQGEFTANMQLFNLFANQASTALKTLGEGVSAIARKT